MKYVWKLTLTISAQRLIIFYMERDVRAASLHNRIFMLKADALAGPKVH